MNNISLISNPYDAYNFYERVRNVTSKIFSISRFFFPLFCAGCLITIVECSSITTSHDELILTLKRLILNLVPPDCKLLVTKDSETTKFWKQCSSKENSLLFEINN